MTNALVAGGLVGGVVLSDLGVCGNLGLERRNVAEAQNPFLGDGREGAVGEPREEGEGLEVSNSQAAPHKVSGPVLGKLLVKARHPLVQCACVCKEDEMRSSWYRNQDKSYHQQQ